MTKTPVGILLSGAGTNAEVLIRASAAPAYPARIALVLSNNPHAPGLQRVAAAGITTRAIDHRLFGPDRAGHERAVDAALREAGVEFIALAGYMRIFTPAFVEAWAGRMINTHPALCPAFPGLHTHARALAAGVKLHGCTVHWVTAGVDEGPPIGQAAVPVLPDDDAETLGARVLAAEHRLYPACLAAVLSGEASPPPADSALFNPTIR